MVGSFKVSRNSYEPINGDDGEFSRTAFIVCVFVMLREFRPVESFITSYLTGPPLFYTVEQVNEEIYPIGTFSSFAFVVILFLITDYFRYKPIIILDGITGILTYALLFGKTTFHIIVLEQIFFGFFYSSDIACNTYLYAKIEDVSSFQRITGYVRASSLFGRFICGVFGQLAQTFNLLSTHSLVYFSAAGMVVATIWSFFVPSVDHSVYFHRAERVVVSCNPSESNNYQSEKEIVVVKSVKFAEVTKTLWSDFKSAYSNKYVVKWTFWWAFAMCGFYFVSTYAQVLWQAISIEQHNTNNLWNGAVDSTYTILSALCAYYTGSIHINWQKHGDWILVIVSLILGGLVGYCYYSNSLLVVYICYVLYGTLFQIFLTIAESEVAQCIEKDSYALIFGFNSFLALGLTTILTYTVVQGNIVYLDTRQQFLFYGWFYIVLSLTFLVKFIASFCLSLKSKPAVVQ